VWLTTEQWIDFKTV